MFYINNELNTTEKYDLAKFIELDDNGLFDSLNSFVLFQIPKLPIGGTHIIRSEENHPDFLSYNIYGDTQYWWILMWYNHLIKPQDLKAGLEINYPSLLSIEQMYRDAALLKKVK